MGGRFRHTGDIQWAISGSLSSFRDGLLPGVREPYGGCIVVLSKTE